VSDRDMVLRGGHVVDPDSGLDAIREVALAGTRVAEIGEGLPRGAIDVDVSGLVVTAGPAGAGRCGPVRHEGPPPARSPLTSRCCLPNKDKFSYNLLPSNSYLCSNSSMGLSSEPAVRGALLSRPGPRRHAPQRPAGAARPPTGSGG